MNTEELQGLEEAIPVISELQNTHSNQLAQYLLNYVLQQDFIDKVVIGGSIQRTTITKYK
ncbi:hypothetical protein JCM19298_1507 [Nonlabens ulvanivorans]|nr:hypothetical protein JCM19298_1507 [Nonlabens ulvanivorans]